MNSIEERKGAGKRTEWAGIELSTIARTDRAEQMALPGLAAVSLLLVALLPTDAVLVRSRVFREVSSWYAPTADEHSSLAWSPTRHRRYRSPPAGGTAVTSQLHFQQRTAMSAADVVKFLSYFFANVTDTQIQQHIGGTDNKSTSALSDAFGWFGRKLTTTIVRLAASFTLVQMLFDE